MDIWNLESIIIYLAVLSGLVIVLFLFRAKINPRFVSIVTLVLSLVIISYNLVSFPYFIQANEWNLQPLPSNEFIDLFENSLSPTRISWVYPLIEDHYLGRTLLIPENLVDTLNLSLERLESQAQLADVKLIDSALNITERDLGQIMGLESAYFLNEKTNRGYYFVTEEKDPTAPLVLLRYENQLFFIPEDLLPVQGDNQ